MKIVDHHELTAQTVCSLIQNRVGVTFHTIKSATSSSILLSKRTIIHAEICTQTSHKAKAKARPAFKLVVSERVQKPWLTACCCCCSCIVPNTVAPQHEAHHPPCWHRQTLFPRSNGWATTRTTPPLPVLHRKNLPGSNRRVCVSLQVASRTSSLPSPSPPLLPLLSPTEAHPPAAAPGTAGGWSASEAGKIPPPTGAPAITRKHPSLRCRCTAGFRGEDPTREERSPLPPKPLGGCAPRRKELPMMPGVTPLELRFHRHRLRHYCC